MRLSRRTTAVLVTSLVLGAGGAAFAVLGSDPSARAAPAATASVLTGDLRTHDPALVVGAGGEPWYLFATGDKAVANGAIGIYSSPDGAEWTGAGTVWDAASEPGWVDEVVPGVSNFWAPEVVAHGGTYYLYYSASTFGSNRSLIGLFTNTTLDQTDPAYAWVDRGEVIRSVRADDFNAIDPGVLDVDGTPWMAFGSFWGGIHLVQLEWPSGKVAGSAAPPAVIASRVDPPNAIEAPYLVARDGFIYLFVSRDSCCQGSASTYNMAVGRAREITGPYLDRDGRDLATGGGTPLLASRGDMIGPGGQSYSAGYLAFHFYDRARGGDFQLAIRKLAWDSGGWPVAATTAELTP